MKTMKKVGVVCIGVALLLVFSTKSARAGTECCFYFNPFFLPFAVAGAALGTAAAITTGFVPAPVYYGPAYYPRRHVYYGPRHVYYGRPYHRGVWVRGHYNRYGARVPGHWKRRF